MEGWIKGPAWKSGRVEDSVQYMVHYLMNWISKSFQSISSIYGIMTMKLHHAQDQLSRKVLQCVLSFDATRKCTRLKWTPHEIQPQIRCVMRGIDLNMKMPRSNFLHRVQPLGLEVWKANQSDSSQAHAPATPHCPLQSMVVLISCSETDGLGSVLGIYVSQGWANGIHTLGYPARSLSLTGVRASFGGGASSKFVFLAPAIVKNTRQFKVIHLDIAWTWFPPYKFPPTLTSHCANLHTTQSRIRHPQQT